jgi:hypothetical protein
MKKSFHRQSSRFLESATYAIDQEGCTDYNRRTNSKERGTWRKHCENADYWDQKRKNRWTFHKQYLLLWGPRDDLGDEPQS